MSPARGSARVRSAALTAAVLAPLACGGWETKPEVISGPNGVEAGAGGAAGSDVGGGGAGEVGPCAPPRNRRPLRGLHVEGNQIKDANDEVVVLRGVNHSGSEYRCIQGQGIFEGPADNCAIAAMASWNVNAVRVPLNESCWLAINHAPEDLSGDSYKTAIGDYVTRLQAFGIVPILDLHWTGAGDSPASRLQPMPNVDHSLDFWRDVAATFRDNDGVVLELFNEPFPDQNRDSEAGWECWRDGCVEYTDLARTRPYEAAGMQALVDAVRDTGAEHVLLLGGLQYSNALSRWLEYRPGDPLENLAAAWHVYNFNLCSNQRCWDGVPSVVAAEVPLVVTEFGQDDCSDGMVVPFMMFLDTLGVGYLAWSWNAYGACTPANRAQRVDGQPFSLVTDYQTGTPNGAYARAVFEHLTGASK